MRAALLADVMGMTSGGHDKRHWLQAVISNLPEDCTAAQNQSIKQKTTGTMARPCNVYEAVNLDK
jgi:hypothetical protein